MWCLKENIWAPREWRKRCSSTVLEIIMFVVQWSRGDYNVPCGLGECGERETGI